MNPVTFAALFLVILLAGSGFYFSYTPFQGELVPSLDARSEASQPSYIATPSAPVRWVRGENKITQGTNGLNPVLPSFLATNQGVAKNDAGLQKLLQEIRETRPGQVQIPQSSPSVSSSQESQKGTIQYYQDILALFGTHGFTADELSLLKRDANNRPFVFEELLRDAANGGDIIPFRDSFRAWAGLDARVATALTGMSVSPDTAPFHSSVVAWYGYRVQLAKRLIEENIPQETLRVLFDEHLQKAKTSVPQFTEPSTLFRSFSLISVAHAQYGAFYDFGGMVTSIVEMCASGMAVSIIGPRPGILFIYWSVFTLNPFLYKSLNLGTQVLGRALWGPGTCTNVGIDAHPSGFAQILFWGSTPR